MDEYQFWSNLERRLGREFAGLPERRHRYFWCDGLNPMRYILDGPSPRITGTAWICSRHDQEVWEFVLVLPQPVESVDMIQWATLLPPDNMTMWMSFDEDKRTLEMDPAAAQPDLE